MAENESFECAVCGVGISTHDERMAGVCINCLFEDDLIEEEELDFSSDYFEVSGDAED